ncbi:MAG TPA: glycosyltransferase family 4 protein [Solirubrobacteraceae bacterium]|nr:glycosyltransferase family 4 protein [Solirubrobacteraceae bacterium]
MPPSVAPRVCIIRHGQYPEDPRVRREAEALLDAGCELDIICRRGDGEPASECVGGAQVHRLPVDHRRNGKLRYAFEYGAFPAVAALTLERLDRRRRFHVVQVNTMPDHLVYAAAPARRRGARVVLDMHDMMPELYESKFGPSPRAVRVLCAVERASVAYADGALVVSEPQRRSLIARGIAADRLTTVMNLPDERIFHARAERPDPSPGPMLISHGTLVERLGYDTAIRAVAIARDRVPDVRLTIVGAGEYEPALRVLAAKLSVQDRVAFLGFRPIEEIPQHIARAHIGVVANKLDSFTDLLVPTKLMEYVAMGLPAIVARTTGVQAYFDDSSVTFFKPDDPADLARAIGQLASDHDGSYRLAERAQNRFRESYSWQRGKLAYQQLVTDQAARAKRL